MRRLIDRCAGIDVGQALLVVCVRVVDGSRLVEEVRSYGATTPELVAPRDWLVGLGVTQVAMESTGVYWKAPYYMLEDEFEVLLVNAAHLKHVPGRKTDVIDAQWIAEVLSYGLLRPSVVPPRPFRELRDLTRYRKSLIRARTGEVNRLHKVLEDAGVTLATVATDVMGVSGREMHALIAGMADPQLLADLAKARLRTKLPQLRKALTARFREHHGYLVARMLSPVEALEADIAAPSQRITEMVEPWAGQLMILDSGHRGRDAGSRGHPCRDRPGHESVPHRGAPGVVGGPVPRPARVRRAAGLRDATQGFALAGRRAHRVRLGRGQDQGHLPVGLLPTDHATPGQAEGDRGGDPQDRGHRLAPAVHRHPLCGPRCWRRAQDQRRTTTPARHPATRSLGLTVTVQTRKETDVA